MQIVRAVAGAILLFLGRELNFLFAAAMAAFIGLRLTPLLPPQWPAWGDYAFMIALAVLAAVIAIINARVGYFLSGFLAGGYFLAEYFAPGVLAVPLLPFLVGGVIGSLIIGIFTEWALMIVSCMVGAYFVMSMFTLSSTAQILVTAGLFVIGALTQAVLRHMQRDD